MSDEQFKVDLIADATDVDLKIKQSNKKLAQFSKESEERGKAKIRINIAKLQSGLDKARAELRKFKKDGDKVGEIQARLKIQGLQANVTSAKKQLKALEIQGNKTKKSFFNLGQITKDLIKGFAGLYVIRSIVGYLKSATQEAIAFESAFAGIRKTTEATEKEFKALEKGIVSLSKTIPLTASELANIGETAGQLGVAKDDILDFTETIAKIGATTNLTEAESATAFARIANIYQEPVKNIENLASAVVDLGNNFATTEREIVNFATRIAGAGKISGLTTSDIVAIGTAFTSVGIEAQAGGTAVQKVLFTLNDAVSEGGVELKKFADLTGQSSEEFAKKWKAEPAKAFDDFVKGIAKSGDKGSAVLEELVAGDQRLARAFLSVAGAGDLLLNAIDKSSEAYIKNTALVEEASKRFDTNASKLKMQAHRWDALNRIVGSFILKGLVPVITFFTDLAEDLVTGTRNLGYFSKAVKAFTALLVAMIAVKIISFITAMGLAVGITSGAITVLTAKVLALKIGLLALPLTIAITASLIGASVVISGLNAIQRKMEEVTGRSLDFIDKNNNKIKEERGIIKEIEKANEKLAKLKTKNAKNEINKNNELIKLSKSRVKEEINQNQVATADMKKSTFSLINDISGKRRKAQQEEIDFYSEKVSLEKDAQNKIIDGLNKADGVRLNSFKKQVRQEREIQEEKEKNEKKPPKTPTGGASAKKVNKEAEKALKDYEKAIKDTDKATEQLAKNTEDYYDDIIDKIQEAKTEQQKLKDELAEFETEEQKGFLRDTAERQVELVNEEKDIRQEIKDERAEDETDQERINDLNDDLNKILKERQEIQTFIDTGDGGGDFQAELDRATERANASSFGLAKLDLDERLELKRIEIQEEIDKQQKILDIQQQFFDLQNAVGKEAEEKRAKLSGIVEGADEMTPEERAQALIDLGFAELDAEEQIELLRQAERFKALEIERKDVENQQKQLLDVKKEYFVLAQEAHKESTDEMIKETDALIARINTAIQAQLRLRALGGSPVPTTGGSETNINITNNNASGVDVDSAMLSLTNKINQ